MVNSIPHREDMENARSLACALLSEEIEKIVSFQLRPIFLW